MKYYIGIDLGGTNIAAGIVDENYNIIAKDSVKTNCPRPAAEIADDMEKVTHQVLQKAGLTLDDIEWIGVGTPGTANRETGVVEFANNLKFYNVPLCQMMEERLGKKVFIENDANAAAYGEVLAGAARGVAHAICITLGTGVGGGIIIDGKIYGGFNFAGAEIGHMVIEHGGILCSCGRKGCFESYSSASALIRMTKEAMEENKDSYMWTLSGQDIEEVNGKTAFDGLRAGDQAATAVVDKFIDYLACGLVNCINIFQPEILVIGGGICKEGETLLAPLRDRIKAESYSINAEKTTKLCVAKLGNDAGIIGAAFLGKLA